MLNQLLLIAALFVPPKDSVLTTHYFWKCLTEGISGDNYFLRSDSLVLVIAQGEGRKYPVRKIGLWNYKNGMIEWIDDVLSKLYRIDTISTLVYLIPKDVTKESVRLDVLQCFKANHLKELNIHAKSPEETQLLLKRVEYLMVRSCLCERDILIEIPEEILHFHKYDFESLPKKSKKRKSEK